MTVGSNTPCLVDDFSLLEWCLVLAVSWPAASQLPAFDLRPELHQ